MTPRRAVVAWIAAGVAGVVAVARFAPQPDDGARCGPGFEPRGARCCARGAEAAPEGDLCGAPRGLCPSPLVLHDEGCDAPETATVVVPAARFVLGPSDWEAEGKVAPRTVAAGPFVIDRFEATVGRLACGPCRARFERERRVHDLARAAYGLSLEEAAAHCAARGGRLPTEDEWIIAASTGAARAPTRYPWGDTGAVCRRAAWGLTAGPCAVRRCDDGQRCGPDTVGAHPSGRTATGLEDMAGNVTEWVAEGFGKGGSFASAFAAEIRVWARLAPATGSTTRAGGAVSVGSGGPLATPRSGEDGDSRFGVRCVYSSRD